LGGLEYPNQEARRVQWNLILLLKERKQAEITLREVIKEYYYR